MATYNESYIKLAYLTYQQMLAAIADGDVTEYNIVYCKDTREQYLISESLSPIPIKSRISTYTSIEEANTEINSDPSYYAGEIVMIVTNGIRQAYLVQGSTSGTLYVEPLTSVTNLNGTSSNPISIKDLTDGNYLVKGVFTINGRTYTSLIGNQFIVETVGGTKSITRVSAEQLYKITVVNGVETVEEYVTTKYLEEQGFVHLADLDNEVAKLGYVKDSTISQQVDQLVEKSLDERLVSLTEQEIDDLFEGEKQNGEVTEEVTEEVNNEENETNEEIIESTEE